MPQWGTITVFGTAGSVYQGVKVRSGLAQVYGGKRGPGSSWLAGSPLNDCTAPFGQETVILQRIHLADVRS